MSLPAEQPDYWSDARTPLASLCFLLPWLLIYEWGIVAAGVGDPDLVRNGADFWVNKTAKGSRLDKFDTVPIFDDLAEDRVLAVEPGCRGERDEELAAVGAGACIRHRERAHLMAVRVALEFIFKTIARAAAASAAMPS